MGKLAEKPFIIITIILIMSGISIPDQLRLVKIPCTFTLFPVQFITDAFGNFVYGFGKNAVPEEGQRGKKLTASRHRDTLLCAQFFWAGSEKRYVYLVFI